jgi:hypothetical protein
MMKKDFSVYRSTIAKSKTKIGKPALKIVITI